jgi:hypothetical protein
LQFGKIYLARCLDLVKSLAQSNYRRMPDDTNPTNTPPPPELVVLGALKEMCEQVRRNNRSPEVARAALAEETRLLARISKLQTGAQSATAAEPA